MNRVKKQITQSIKPSSLLPKTSGMGGKGKDLGDGEESKDTPTGGSSTARMSLAGKRAST